MINKILVLLVVVLYSGCTQKNLTNDFFIVNKNLNKALKEFQQQHVPNKDKIILLELYKCSPRLVYEISRIEYPHLFEENKQYLTMSVNSSIVFYKPPASFEIKLFIDTNKINRIIQEKYAEYLNQDEYEIDLATIHESWYVYEEFEVRYDTISNTWDNYGEKLLRVFNMSDSISLHGSRNIHEQYNKLKTHIGK